MPLTTLTDSFKTLLRGLLAGLIAGLLAGAVAFTLGEPHVQAAINIEESAAAAEAPGADHHAGEATTDPGAAEESAGHSHGDEEPLVSRTGQRAGLFLATALAGLALGAIFAVVVHYARRFTAVNGPLLAIAVAGCGWLAIEAVPFFKYPANPPAVGDPDTINERTLLWLASVILGLAAVAVAVYVGRALRNQQLVTLRVIGQVAAFLVVAAIGYIALPGINEVGEDFPATLLWEFRVSSLATQAMLWLALGLAFAFLTERAHRRVTR
ncbi:CbtA family protein [Rhodococcus sp. TAF43]|uniref:CbtA family protein n=1 Tax=unclassified Rhodococcus (in: high G+C Gram-positive bacteria) TaxID=192944 RepID=UPI0015831634|nr:CbtA family protein [Rhodococcus sp. W8901]QKT09928.1 CbtA family protein [Rhodococcus sp. W8901]